jgi:hypothetical protein
VEDAADNADIHHRILSFPNGKEIWCHVSFNSLPVTLPIM